MRLIYDSSHDPGERKSMKIQRLCAVAIGAIGCGAAFSASAAATPPEGDVLRTDLAKGVTDAPVSIVSEAGRPTTLIVQNLVLKPGADSGWHTHDGTEFSVITAGSVALQQGPGCAMVRYGQGQAVFIPAGVPHRVENDGPVDATVVVNYTLPAGAPPRGDSPDVCGK
jgi:quercetin dioxygenase-like cupin family protein